MQRRLTWIFSLLMLGVLAMGTLLWGQGEQGKPPRYTYVSQWAVPRAQWGEMTKLGAVDRAIFDRFLADGTIGGYGDFQNLIHTEGEPTHGSWFTASSEGNILKVLAALYAQPEATAPVLAASKHWDHFLMSHDYNGVSGNFDGAYLSGAQWDVKLGQTQAFRGLLKSRVLPVLDKLVADGTVVAYSVDTEYYHTRKPGIVSLVTIAPDAAAVDKVDQAFEGTFGKDPEIGPALRAMTHMENNRDFLLQIMHMVNK